MPTETLTRALSVTEAGPARIPLARGVRAGHWVFIAGLLPDDLGDAERPRSGHAGVAATGQIGLAERGRYPARRRRRPVAAGALRSFFQDWRAVPFFHQARAPPAGAYIAPSTSVLQPEMLIPGAAMMTDMIAVAADGPAIEPIFPDGLDIPSTSSFVPVVKAGNLVFVAGFLAAHQPGDLGGIAPEAKVPDGHLWKGNRIQLEGGLSDPREAHPALAGAGLGAGDVVKANVYLSDIEDVPAFNQSGPRLHGVDSSSGVRSHQHAGLCDRRRAPGDQSGRRRRRRLVRIESGRAAYAICYGHPVAVRAGDILLFSGMVAADPHGLIEAARIDNRSRYLASSIEAQWTISSTLPRRSARGPAPACATWSASHSCISTWRTSCRPAGCGSGVCQACRFRSARPGCRRRCRTGLLGRARPLGLRPAMTVHIGDAHEHQPHAA